MIWILVIITLFFVITVIMKKRVYVKLYYYLNTEDYDNFFEIVDSRVARTMIPIYIREYYKLTALIKINDVQKVTKQFNYLMKLNLRGNQLNSVLICGFNYYCYQEDDKKCKKILNEMKLLFDQRQYFKYERHFNIVMNKATKYIADIEKELDEHRGRKKAYLEYLLAKSYQSKNDQIKYNKYLRLSMEDYQVDESQFEEIIQVI